MSNKIHISYSESEKYYEKKYNPSIELNLSVELGKEQNGNNSQVVSSQQELHGYWKENHNSWQPKPGRVYSKNLCTVFMMDKSNVNGQGITGGERHVGMNHSRNGLYHNNVRQASYRDEEPFDVSNNGRYTQKEALDTNAQYEDEIEDYDYPTGVDEAKSLDLDEGENNEYCDSLDDSYHIQPLQSDTNNATAADAAATNDGMHEDGEFDDDINNILQVMSDDIEDEPAMSMTVHCINSNNDYKTFADNGQMIDKRIAVGNGRQQQQVFADTDIQMRGDMPEFQKKGVVDNNLNVVDKSKLDGNLVDNRLSTSTPSRKEPTSFSKQVSAEDYQRKSPMSANDIPASSYMANPESTGRTHEKFLDEDFDTELSWRLDPSVSLSDWTVEVVVTDHRGELIRDCPKELYCVHKSVLAVGPRRSAYFVNEFKQHAAEKKAAVEAEKQRTIILLERLDRQKEQDREAAHLLLDNDTSDVFEMQDNPFTGLAAVGCNLIGVPLQNLIQMEKMLTNHNCASPSTSTAIVLATPVATSMNPPVPVQARSSPEGPASRLQRPVTPLPQRIEVIKSSSTLELQELAAEAFPYALDFIYSTIGKLDIMTENASALYYLSKKLDVKSLQYKVEQFWKADMTMDTVMVYYQHGRLFKDSALIAAAELLCAHHLLELSDDVVVDLLATVNAPFMCNVVTIVAEEALARHASQPNSNSDPAFNEELNKFYLQLSLLIAVYCNIHRHSLTPDMFWKLTHERQLPVLEVKAAKALLDVQHSIVGPNSDLTSLTA
jgi:hypothetical protein